MAHPSPPTDPQFRQLAADAEAPPARRGAPSAAARPRGAIRLIDTPSGEAFDAEYLGETPEGFGFSVEGTEIVIPHADFETGVIALGEPGGDPGVMDPAGAQDLQPDPSSAGDQRKYLETLHDEHGHPQMEVWQNPDGSFHTRDVRSPEFEQRDAEKAARNASQAADETQPPVNAPAPAREAQDNGTLRTHAFVGGRGAEPAPSQGDLGQGVQRDPALAEQPAGSGAGADAAGAEPARVDRGPDAGGLAGILDAGDLDVPVISPPSAPSIEPIRRNAAVLRGVPKDAPLDVPGVTLRWDEQAGGFIFNRSHSDVVQAAVDGAGVRSASNPDQITDPQKMLGETDAEAPADPNPIKKPGSVDVREPASGEQQIGLPRADEQQVSPDTGTALDQLSDEQLAAVSKALGYRPRKDGDKAKRIEQIMSQPEEKVRAALESATSIAPPANDASATQGEDEPIVPSPAAQQFEAAAREADTAPTDAQKVAGNYRKGRARWQGFGLSIENAKGSERSGKGPDGKAWSVTMPAHYGYVLGTRGADKDQVDFYMGDDPESDFVLIVDQKDADSGEWDEHKAILGTANATEALDLYKAGFSDGRGADRIGGVRKMDAAEFKEWIRSGDTTKPASAKFRGKVKGAKGTAREEPKAEKPDDRQSG